MAVGLLAVAVIAAVALAIVFAFFLVRHYVDPSQSSALVNAVSMAAIAVALLCVLLIPVDVYSVSSDLRSDGSQADPDQAKETGEAIKYLYYILYAAMIFLAFVAMPFVYFYYEEDAEVNRPGKRAFGALKYTAGFVVVWCVLMALGLILKQDKGSDDDNHWRKRLSNNFNNGESVLMFTVGVLACVGVLGWITYAGYGLASLPAQFVRGSSAEEAEEADIESVQRGRYARVGAAPQLGASGDLDYQIRANQEKLDFLSMRYADPSQYPPKDRLELARLRQEDRRLRELKRQAESGAAARGSGGRGKGCCHFLWNASLPVRMCLAVVLVLLSLFVVVSMMLSSVDRIVNSECGASCGYSLERPRITNPLDAFLKVTSKVFPIDFVFFGVMVLWIFLAIVAGLVSLGVRFTVFKLYDVYPKATLPHAMLMGFWLVMFAVLVLNMIILNLSPRYASFGNQFYTTEDEEGRRTTHDCTLHYNGTGAGTSVCVLSQAAKFIQTSNSHLPFFGVALFYANLLFLLTYLVSQVWVFARGVRKAAPQTYARMPDGRSIWDD